MAVEVDIDVEVLKCEIKKTYARVSQEPEENFIFPTGRAWVLDLGYPPELVDRLPEAAAESFAGVANPFALGTLAHPVSNTRRPDPAGLLLALTAGINTAGFKVIPEHWRSRVTSRPVSSRVRTLSGAVLR